MHIHSDHHRKLHESRVLHGTISKPGLPGLVMAAQRGHIELCRSMLRSGVDVDAPNDDGMTALMAAARLDYWEICELLLASGADPQRHDRFGWTALDYAHSPDVHGLIARHGSRATKVSP